MTELEMMQRAKMYIDKMANGIDPQTDRPVPDSDCINQVRISRCLFYVSDVLRRVIENGGNITRQKTGKKLPFVLSDEQARTFPFSHTPINVSEITNRINNLIDQTVTAKLKTKSITGFLLQCGLLSQTEDENGRSIKVPTPQGESIGLFSEERFGQGGPYRVVLYKPDAQQFILDNIDAIIAINNQT